jgi:hypothetical protein
VTYYQVQNGVKRTEKITKLLTWLLTRRKESNIKLPEDKNQWKIFGPKNKQGKEKISNTSSHFLLTLFGQLPSGEYWALGTQFKRQQQETHTDYSQGNHLDADIKLP